MGIEHYAFALFVSGLICLIAILTKILFADVKRQRKLLDEKESKLLQLYQSVEGIMEEFSDQVESTAKELKEYETRIAKRAAAIPPKPPEPVAIEKPAEKPSRPLTVDQSRIRAASEVIERAERVIKGDMLKPPQKNENGTVFHRFFDDSLGDAQAAETETSAKQKRNDSILALAAQGKSNAQIAQELGITQNEVKFIIELGTGKL